MSAQNEIRSVGIVGLGYIGLPTAAAFAAAGLSVHGVDIDPRVIAAVSAGETPIEEPGLPELVAKVVAEGRLTASSRGRTADAHLIAVPTPFVPGDPPSADMRYVHAAADALAPLLAPGTLIVLESTSPVGATREMIARFAALRPDLVMPSDEADGDIDVAYSPERVIPGRTMVELTSNARVVGGRTKRAAERARALYAKLTSGEIVCVDDRTAEFVKLAENAYRDVNIAFANEVSMVCGDLGLDPWTVIRTANLHPRVSILQPGPGVGGHCIAVDPWFIVAQAPSRARLIRTAREVNDAKPAYVIAEVERLAAGLGPEARIICLGLAYKPDVDDFRESPSLEIARHLSHAYPGRVVCCDPFAVAMSPAAREGLAMVEPGDVLGADALAVALVAHAPYKALARPRLAVDACGLWR
jgi:UDP-N-acetyl-D-mannosaminuronic acid dehydrogenase